MVDNLGPWFEHLLGLKKSDLLSGHYTYADVVSRVEWIQQFNSDGAG